MAYFRFHASDGDAYHEDIERIARATLEKLPSVPIGLLSPHAIAGSAMRRGIEALWDELGIEGVPSVVTQAREAGRRPVKVQG